MSDNLRDEVLAIRGQLKAALARCDRMLAGLPARVPGQPGDAARYRLSPGGPLSPIGVAEMRRRFEAGETDTVIAREMRFSVQGVAKRRRYFESGAGPRRTSGVLEERIVFSADFDETDFQQPDPALHAET